MATTTLDRTPTTSPGVPGGEPVRIGPNALRQTLAAARARLGPGWAPYLATRAELPSPLPRGMVEEAHFVELVRVLVDELGPDTALELLEEGGRLTGRYVLSCRIPTGARGALRLLPPPLALPLLLAACAKHAWTFAGSGVFDHTSSREGAVLRLEGSPTCRHGRVDRPMGSFYAGAFQHLVRSLVAPGARVVETECMATGAAACRFQILLPRRARWRPARFADSTLSMEPRGCASY